MFGDRPHGLGAQSMDDVLVDSAAQVGVAILAQDAALQPLACQFFERRVLGAALGIGGDGRTHVIAFRDAVGLSFFVRVGAALQRLSSGVPRRADRFERCQRPGAAVVPGYPPVALEGVAPADGDRVAVAGPDGPTETVAIGESVASPSRADGLQLDRRPAAAATGLGEAGHRLRGPHG